MNLTDFPVFAQREILPLFEHSLKMDSHFTVTLQINRKAEID
jgi:hypothetical protein